MRYSLRTVLLVLMVVAIAISSGYWYPKEKHIPLFDGNITIAYYRGFGYSPSRVYLITVSPYDASKGHWRVAFTGPGQNQFKRFDANGHTVETGECDVMVFGEWIWPQLEKYVVAEADSDDE